MTQKVDPARAGAPMKENNADAQYLRHGSERVADPALAEDRAAAQGTTAEEVGRAGAPPADQGGAKNYNTREDQLHRRAQEAESDVLRLTKRYTRLLEAFDGLAIRFVGAIRGREQFRLEARLAKEAPGLAVPAAPLEWQPIETAPMDGTVFRAYAPALVDPDFNPWGSVEAVFDGERTIGVYGGGHGVSLHRYQRGERSYSAAEQREAMGIDWMTVDELSQAIPPAYTEFIGYKLLEALRS